MTKTFQLLILVTALSAAVTHAASAGSGPRLETRARVTCSDGSTLTERLRAEDGHLRIDLELEHLRRRGTWRVVIIHERQLVARATVTAASAGGVLQLHRTAPDWFGRDSVVSRAAGPGGAQCSVTATL